MHKGQKTAVRPAEPIRHIAPAAFSGYQPTAQSHERQANGPVIIWGATLIEATFQNRETYHAIVDSGDGGRFATQS